MPRIGIDLGTTNTLAALVYDDGPHVIPRGAGESVPSVVRFGEGEGAKGRGGREAANEIDRVVRSVKRLMGRTYSEAIGEGAREVFPRLRAPREGGGNDLGLELRGRWLYPPPLAARGERAHPGPRAPPRRGRHRAAVDSAVITVPAYFRDPHRSATLDAAREAGLLVRAATCSTSRAPRPSPSPRGGVAPGEQVLVVDWGGGPSTSRCKATRAKGWLQRAIDGDLVLGGDDLERRSARARGGHSAPARMLRTSRLLAAPRGRPADEGGAERAAGRGLHVRGSHPETGRPVAVGRDRHPGRVRGLHRPAAAPRRARSSSGASPSRTWTARRSGRCCWWEARRGSPRFGPRPGSVPGPPPRRRRPHGGGGPGRGDLRQRPARDRRGSAPTGTRSWTTWAASTT